MEYLVMECHISYAVVLDSRGRFQKVANLGYQVGQELSTVVVMEEPKRAALRWQPLAALAACLCIAFTGVWQLMLLSMGTVLVQINPQIRLSINRMERVISAEALNADGAKVLFDYHPFGKTVEQVAGELGDRAAAMGYLTEGGEVRLTVDSKNAAWRTETERRLEAVVIHDAQRITIIISHGEEPDVSADPPGVTQDSNALPDASTAPQEPLPDRDWEHHGDSHHDDDDDDDDDDDEEADDDD